MSDYPYIKSKVNTASDVLVDVSTFDKVLSSSDIDIQQCLETINKNEYVTSLIDNISSNLQSQIDNLDLSTYATTSLVNSISSNLFDYSTQIDENQMLSLIEKCPVYSFIESVSGFNIVYHDFRGVTNHEKTVVNDVDGLPIQKIETFNYNNYSYSITKNMVFNLGDFQSSTINILKV